MKLPWTKKQPEPVQTPTLDAVRRYYEASERAITNCERDARRDSVISTVVFVLANIALLCIAWHFSKKVAAQ